MFKHVIKYDDFDGNTYEEEFCFNISKGEIVEMELSEEGGLEGLIDKMIKEKDRKKLVELFRALIEKSVGIKEGKRFVKNDEIRRDFMESNAYSEFLIELLSNEKIRAAFVLEAFPNNGKKSLDEAIIDMNKGSEEFDKIWNGGSVK